MSNTVLSSVSADGLTKSVANSSACIVMVKFRFSIHTGLVLDFFNSSPPGQNGRHFADDTFREIFMNEKFCKSIRISLKFVAKVSIDNNWALVKIMTWHRLGDKPLSEPMIHWCIYVALGGDEIKYTQAQIYKHRFIIQNYNNHKCYSSFHVTTIYCGLGLFLIKA